MKKMLVIVMLMTGCAATKAIKKDPALDMEKDLGPVIQVELNKRDYATKRDLRQVRDDLLRRVDRLIAEYYPSK